MRNTVHVLATSAVFAFAGSAHAQDLLKWSEARFYAGAEIGRSEVKMDSGGFNTLGPFPNTRDDKDHSSFILIKGGVDFGNLRFDLSFRDYTQSKFKTASFAPPTPTFFYKSEVDNKAFMASAYYDIFEYEKFVLYGGAGAGIARSKVSANDTVVKGSESDNNFAWQLELGVEYPVTKELHIGGGIRHVDLGKTKIGLRSFPAPAPAGDFTADQKANELFVGFRYTF